MATYTWNADAVTAEWTDTSEWNLDGSPVDRFPIDGDTAEIGAGTVELDLPQLYNAGVVLFQPMTNVSADNVELVAPNVDLGDAAQVFTASLPAHLGSIIYDVVDTGTLDSSHTFGVPAQPGVIDFAAAPLTIELTATSTTDPTATFTNDGAILGGVLSIVATSGTETATFVNNTTIDVTGPLDLGAGVTLAGSGTVDLDGFEASAKIGGAVGAGQTFSFINGPSGTELGGTLVIDNDMQFLGTVDLDANHMIMVPGSLVSGSTVFPDGQVSLSDGSMLDVVPVNDANTIQAYAYPGAFGAAGETFIQAVEVVAPCFCAGTRVATALGHMDVEDVRVGDAMLLARGGTAPVVWVGQRDVDCGRHPRPHNVWPVRVRAGAVAPGVPWRDLRLSPDHAIAVAGRLIPVRHLINGATIVQEPEAVARYHHIELARHDLLLAEGLAAESFLDTGNRSGFCGGGPALALHPEFARRVWADAGCAPLVERGAALAEARRTVLRQAARLGHRRTADAALRVLADGRAVRPESAVGWRFHLPAGMRELRLVSRIWVPAAMQPDEDDARRLGVAIGRLWLDGREVSLESRALVRGWHAPEPGGRWTDGDAVLAAPGARTLSFTLAMAGTYWRDRPAHAARRPA